jgi:hypothetical protein
VFAYIDAYTERLDDETQASFQSAIEAARAGAIFSRYENRRQYESWRRKMRVAMKDPTEEVGLSGQALESAIMGFAAMHPEYVVVGEKA